MLDPKLLRSDLAGRRSRVGETRFRARYGRVRGAGRAAQEHADRSGSLESRAQRQCQGGGHCEVERPGCGPLLAAGEALGAALQKIEKRLEVIQAQVTDLQLGLPNILHASVPEGLDESANVEVRRFGMPREFTFTPKDHVALGEPLGMDFEAAGRISGARFVVLSGMLARLHRALAQFMLDLHVQNHGYQETYVPYLVHAAALLGTGQLPKFEQDQFAVRGDPGFYLIPTAEVPLTNLVRDQILAPERCRSNLWRTRHAFARRRVQRARTRAA